MIIQNLSIPTHSQSATKPIHTMYHIRVTTPTATYTIPTRYSELLQLNDTLSALPGSSSHKLPSFPPRRVFSVLGLSEGDTIARRVGLETYLKTILTSSDTFYSTSKPFLKFLQPKEGQIKPALSASGWMTQYESLVAEARSLNVKLSKRDSLLANASTSSQAHPLTAEVRKELVSLVSQIQVLGKQVHELGQGGMVEAELARRREMVVSLEEKSEVLGVLVNRRVQTKKQPGQEETPSSQKQALLGMANGPVETGGRVLGTVSPQETAATRALDNAGLMQLQQQYMETQDSRLEDLTAALRRQRVLGEAINDELKRQDEIMDVLEDGVGRVGRKLGNAQQLAKKLG